MQKTKSLDKLLAQREALEREIKEAISLEKDDALIDVICKIKKYGFTKEDLGFNSPEPYPSYTRKPAKVIYADMNGNTWTGRGKTPKWLWGKDRSMYLVD